MRMQSECLNFRCNDKNIQKKNDVKRSYAKSIKSIAALVKIYISRQNSIHLV